ncbi:MAG: hypothetical protein Q4A52_07150 [Bacillota bacterium]|nr:hypothetical protein [Bacillota bacterium]
MEKTKLGISVSLVGASIYFFGLVSAIPLVILALYVHLREENAWLKRTATKAVVVYLFFAVLSGLLGLLDNSFEIINDLLRLLIGHSLDFSALNIIVSICSTALVIARNLFLLLLGFNALKQKDMKFGPADDLMKDQ